MAEEIKNLFQYTILFVCSLFPHEILTSFFKKEKKNNTAFSFHSGCCCCSVTKLRLTLCDSMNCSQPSLSFTISPTLLKLRSIESVMPSSHFILCCALPSCPQSFPSGPFLMSWPFASGGQFIGAFSIYPSNEYSGLISFWIDSFDLLAAQGTLKSLLQHHSSKASILGPLTFFMVQLSHPYMTTGKTIALTISLCQHHFASAF